MFKYLAGFQSCISNTLRLESVLSRVVRLQPCATDGRDWFEIKTRPSEREINESHRSKSEQNTFLSGLLFLIIFFPLNRQQLIWHWHLEGCWFFSPLSLKWVSSCTRGDRSIFNPRKFEASCGKRRAHEDRIYLRWQEKSSGKYDIIEKNLPDVQHQQRHATPFQIWTHSKMSVISHRVH